MAAATRMVTRSLAAILSSPCPKSVADGAGRSLASDPQMTLTPAKTTAEHPRRATSAGMICSCNPRVIASHSRPRTAATTMATPRAGHQPMPKPIRPSAVMRSPWSTAASVPIATTATFGIRTAW
jgi:hypothetical protein